MTPLALVVHRDDHEARTELIDHPRRLPGVDRVRPAHRHQQHVDRADGRQLLVVERVPEIAEVRDAQPADLEDEHRVEAALRAAFVVVVDADRPDRHVAKLLVDARPPLLVGGQAPDDVRLAPDEADVVVVGVLVADRDEVGPQAGGQLVAEPLAERVHHHPRPGRGLEQEAGLPEPGQLADDGRARRAGAIADPSADRQQSESASAEQMATCASRGYVISTCPRNPEQPRLSLREGEVPQRRKTARRDPRRAADGARRLHHEGRPRQADLHRQGRRAAQPRPPVLPAGVRATAATSCRCSRGSSPTSRPSSPPTRRRRCCSRTRSSSATSRASTSTSRTTRTTWCCASIPRRSGRGSRWCASSATTAPTTSAPTTRRPRAARRCGS